MECHHQYHTLKPLETLLEQIKVQFLEDKLALKSKPLESKSITVSDQGEQKRWMIEISADLEQTVEVSYQWE